MNRLVLVISLLALAACKEDLAGKPQPVALTAEAVGHYCQMELLEHEGPKGQLHLDGMDAPVFFSQVRDAIGYLHMPEQSHAVRAAYVQDMTGATWAEPGDWIAIEDATYVIGSDRMGGMGAPELVPFSDKASALEFAALYGGEVRRFDEIGPEDTLVAILAEPAVSDDVGARLNALSHKKGSH